MSPRNQSITHVNDEKTEKRDQKNRLMNLEVFAGGLGVLPIFVDKFLSVDLSYVL